MESFSGMGISLLGIVLGGAFVMTVTIALIANILADCGRSTKIWK